MRRKWLFVVAPVALVVFIFIGGEVVQNLWNWLGPELFGLRTVTFWQALGLLLLCRILFGNLGGGGGGMSRSRRKAAERWDKMPPEERERIREYLRSRMHGPGAAGADEPPGGNA